MKSDPDVSKTLRSIRVLSALDPGPPLLYGLRFHHQLLPSNLFVAVDFTPSVFVSGLSLARFQAVLQTLWSYLFI